jgi:TPR repeat protein
MQPPKGYLTINLNNYRNRINSEMPFKIIISLSYFLSLTISAEAIPNWKLLDIQNQPQIVNVYKGEYKEVITAIEKLAKEGDKISSFYLATMYDFSVHFIHCSGSREKCKPRGFGVPDGSEFSNRKAVKWYKFAAELGHPYANYMLAMHLKTRRKHIPNKIKKKALETLAPLAKAGDGVATFMYYNLQGNFSLAKQTAQWSLDIQKKQLNEAISKLEIEAKDGRVLAMHFLGKAYFNLWKYPEAFAWFTAASKHGFWRSSNYQEMVLDFIEKEDSTRTVKQMRDILALFDMTIDS